MKEYLGDSVYAHFDGFGIMLTTENGDRPSNTIYLEPEILSHLNKFADRIRKMRRQEEVPPANPLDGGMP